MDFLEIEPQWAQPEEVCQLKLGNLLEQTHISDETDIS